MSDVYLYKNELWRVAKEFHYTGDYEQFNLNPGKYLVICKGASGGKKTTETFVNRGGTSYGVLNLTSSLSAYAVVGGNGEDSGDAADTNGAGGYNGGGDGGKACPGTTYYNGAGGGGATDIRLEEPGTMVTEQIEYDLPNDFQAVEYLQASSSVGQWIDTEYIHNSTSRFDCDMYAYDPDDDHQNWSVVFGARNDTLYYNAFVLFASFSGGYDGHYCRSGEETRIPSWPNNQKIHVSASGLVCNIYDETGETLITSVTSGGTNDGGISPITLFRLNYSSNRFPNMHNSEHQFTGKMYNFAIYESDELLHYFVPVRRKNNSIEYDIDITEFEQGTIRSNGDDSDSTRVRTNIFYPASDFKGTLTFEAYDTDDNRLEVSISEYKLNDKSSSYILALGNWISNDTPCTFTTQYTKYIRFILRRPDQSNINPSQIKSFKVTMTNPDYGMFDIVEQKFHPNQSITGNFVKGNDITFEPVVVEKTYDKSLYTRIIVAGGGGGGQNINDSSYQTFSGFGGGVNGGYPHAGADIVNALKYASQQSGYAFGNGQTAPDKIASPNYGAEGSGGGGGGWYGGYAITSTNAQYSSGNGGGGSGYVLTSLSYKPDKYLDGISRQDIYFTNELLTSGMAEEACILICESVEFYNEGDRLICECIGESTQTHLYRGEYTVKCYGGCGGTRSQLTYSALGGFAQGTFNVTDPVDAFIYVGGSALFGGMVQSAEYTIATHPTLSFNGGGLNKPLQYGGIATGAMFGGGATDVRLGSSSLYARLIVAGGAGGQGRPSSYNGAGGGTTGANPTSYYGNNYGGGTQTGAGTGGITDICGGFGYGGQGLVKDGGYGGAGGGGWYGGSGTSPDGNTDDDSGGAGGSGYVLTATSSKPAGYLLGPEYNMHDTALTQGGNLLPLGITKCIIECDAVHAMEILCHDDEGYKCFDETQQKWVFLKENDPTVSDFTNYGVLDFTTDEGLLDEYSVWCRDMLNVANTFVANVIPPLQTIKTRYQTPYMLSRATIDADSDEDVTTFTIDAKRKGVDESAYIEFTITCNMTDVPKKETRVYCVQGYSVGSTEHEYHEPVEPVYLEHIDLLPVGTGNRVPSRYKNYIGSMIDGSTAISTINSACCCEYNRCIYSATVCNDTIVRFAKLNLLTNTSIIIKDIPRSQLGSTYYGDIKVDDDYIYITSSDNNNKRIIWVTPNSSDTTVEQFSPGNSNDYNFNAYGKMYWYDPHTIAILYRRGIYLFDTKKRIFTDKRSSIQNASRRDFILGKRYALSLLDGNSRSAYVCEVETNTWTTLNEDHHQQWAGEYKNVGCYNDGVFYVTQQNRLHFLDEETMTITKSIGTPYTNQVPKSINYSDGILYITIENSQMIYIYDITNDRFMSTGLPFTMDSSTSNKWKRPLAFNGYYFIPEIRLYVTNFVMYAKYNMGYKFNQFIMITDRLHELEQEYEYDDRFVTFTDSNMWIHAADLPYPLTTVDPQNKIKYTNINKADYNKFVAGSMRYIVEPDDDDEGGEDVGE